MRFGKLNRDAGFKPRDVRCTQCGGLGFKTVWIGRTEGTSGECRACAGSGKREVQVARTLSGENDPNPPDLYGIEPGYPPQSF